MEIRAVYSAGRDDGAEIVQRIVHASDRSAILRRCDLNEVHWSSEGGDGRKERQHKSSSDERREIRGGRSDDGADADTCAADEDGPSTTGPVCHPGE